MENSQIQNEILETVKGLPDGTADQVLDFILFLKQRRKAKTGTLNKFKKNNKRNLLLELGKGLFDGEDDPNDTASEHDKYLYGNYK